MSLMGETTQLAAESGLLDHVIFGRNEPALHHYHNTIRAALGQPPLRRLRSDDGRRVTLSEDGRRDVPIR
jgi:hypothetical protein